LAGLYAESIAGNHSLSICAFAFSTGKPVLIGAVFSAFCVTGLAYYFLKRFKSNVDPMPLFAMNQVGRDSDAIICLLLPSGRIEQISESSLHVLGYSSELLIGRRVQRYLSREDLKKVWRDLVSNVYRSHNTFRFRARALHASGRYVWLETLVAPLSIENSLSIRIFAITRDITAQVKSEFVEAEASSSLVINEMREGIVIFDKDARVIRSNASARAILGLTDKQLRAQEPIDPSWSISFDESDQPRSFEALVEHLRNLSDIQKDTLAQIRYVDQNHWVLLSCDSISDKNADGSCCFTMTLTDVTSQKESISRLRNYAHELEAKKAELEKANSVLHSLATNDSLTGLKNYRAFHERISSEIQRSLRSGSAVSLVLLDVDNFKRFNDQYGHLVGDDILRTVGHVLKSNVREMDIAARYGGEEFAVILPDTGEDTALVAAERIRKAIEKHNWNDRNVTVSVGVSVFDNTKSTPEKLIFSADQALYRSKARGKNCVTIDNEVKMLK
jgi:diguanylate cyclase (GGDEF)-like protein/PAS domain S-box-containing protein